MLASPRFSQAVSLFILLFGSSLAACDGSSRLNPGAATAQAERAIHLATQMAGSLQRTARAGRVNSAATQMAAESGFQAGAAWPLVAADPFDDNRNEWPTGEGDDPLAAITWTLESGRYRWQATANDSFVWWSAPFFGDVDSFLLSTDIQLVSGPPDAEHGLVFRLDSDSSSYFLFEINGRGQFGLFLHTPDGWETLIDWQDSDQIQPQGTNRLSVLAQGDRFIFSINGQPAAEWSDTRLPSGQAGVAAGLANAGDEAVWEFDNFELRSENVQSTSQP